MAGFSGIGRAGDGVRTPDKDIMGGRGLLNHCFNLKAIKHCFAVSCGERFKSGFGVIA